jgi:hypothetical protein
LRRAQIRVEARLQLAQSLEITIGLLNRHAPTWRPLDHRFRRTSLPRACDEPAPLPRSTWPPA